MKFRKVILSISLLASLSSLYSDDVVYVQGFTFLVPSKEFAKYRGDVNTLLRNNGFLDCNMPERSSMGELKKLNIVCKGKSKFELDNIYRLLLSNAKYKLERGQMNNMLH